MDGGPIIDVINPSDPVHSVSLVVGTKTGVDGETPGPGTAFIYEYGGELTAGDVQLFTAEL
jgi:hypothetical protein